MIVGKVPCGTEICKLCGLHAQPVYNRVTSRKGKGRVSVCDECHRSLLESATPTLEPMPKELRGLSDSDLDRLYEALQARLAPRSG